MRFGIVVQVLSIEQGGRGRQRSTHGLRDCERIAGIAGLTDGSVCPTLIRFVGQALSPANRFKVYRSCGGNGPAGSPSLCQSGPGMCQRPTSGGVSTMERSRQNTTKSARPVATIIMKPSFLRIGIASRMPVYLSANLGDRFTAGRRRALRRMRPPGSIARPGGARCGTPARGHRRGRATRRAGLSAMA